MLPVAVFTRLQMKSYKEKINLFKEKHRDYNITSIRVEEISLFFYTVEMYMTKKEEIDID